MTTTENKPSINELRSQPASYSLRPRSTCTRCGGLMVNEVCIDLFNSASELDCTAKRCIQCGDIIDAVILRNRQLRQASSALRSTVTQPFSTETHVAA